MVHFEMGNTDWRTRVRRGNMEKARAALAAQRADVDIQMGEVEIEEEEEEIEEDEEEIQPQTEREVGPPPIVQMMGPGPLNIGGLQMAFSAMLSGVNPTKGFEFLRLLNADLPSLRCFYQSQHTVGSMIVRMAEESMAKVRAGLPQGTVVSIDGSWDHRRNGANCSLCVIDQGSGKVVDLVNVSRKVDPASENYCPTPQSMEAKALGISLKKLMQLPQIVAYVHDNDAHASRLIRDSHWNVEEKLDPNHCAKSFERRLATFRGRHGKILDEIEESLKKWFHALIRSPISPDEKAEMWHNCINHYKGDHTKCRHKEDQVCQVWSYANSQEHVKLLEGFLKATEKFVRKVDLAYSTQRNESFNLRKTRYAPKHVCWQWSYLARVMCAVLDVNEGPVWKLRLLSRLGLPQLSPANARFFMVKEAEFDKHLNEETKKKRTGAQQVAMTPEQARLAYKENPYHQK